MEVKGVHYLLWVLSFFPLLAFCICFYCMCKLRQAFSDSKRTGILMYMFLIFYTFYTMGILGGISGKDEPWNPAKDDNDWEPENRLFRMFFSIIDILATFFYFTIFIQAVRVLKEGHMERGANPIMPQSALAKFARNFVLIIVLGGYLAGMSLLCYLYQSTEIKYSTFVLPIYIAQISYSAILPLIVLLMTLKYKGSSFVNSKFKVAFYNLLVVLLIWGAAKIYRGIHGILEDDMIFKMLEDNENKQLIIDGILYFISELLPLLLMVSPLVYPAFFLSYKEQGGYKHFLNGHHTAENSIDNK